MGGRSSLPPDVLGSGTSLWRVPASGAGEPEQLPFSWWRGFLRQPSPGAATGWRTSGRRSTPTYGVFRCRAREWPAGPPARFIASTRGDSAPQYSPDGKRIAFESDRSGVHGIWVSDADGSNAVELFSQAGASCGTARWSPDGQRIAFDSNPEGNFDIYVIRASGGKPIRLDHRFRGRRRPKLVERWQVGLLYIETDRSIRGMEGTGRRRRGCSR